MIDMEFVLIQPGTFLMGSPKTEFGRYPDETQHEVTLTQAYYLQATPVTQGQWQAVMGNNPSYFQGINNPVDSVSWHDAQAFIAKLNTQGKEKYRLPTEAEWEYACRAGASTPFSCGESITAEQANFDGNIPYNQEKKNAYREDAYRGTTTPVKSFAPNAWGLYDMHGNVEEWVQDWYEPYSSSAVTDPQGPESGDFRVHRGGFWYSYAWHIRSASRDNNLPDSCVLDFGFRLVKEVRL
jgi:formylglycine-generating enzyme required for sulfatase activity